MVSFMDPTTKRIQARTYTSRCAVFAQPLVHSSQLRISSEKQTQPAWQGEVPCVATVNLAAVRWISKCFLQALKLQPLSQTFPGFLSAFR